MSLAGFFEAHLPILPVLLPAGTAMLLLLIGDAGADTAGQHGHHRRKWARRIAIVSVTLGLLLAARLAIEAHAGLGELKVYRVGAWPAPFGIVLVIDRLSALMLLLTGCIALPVLVYASGGWDAHGRYFHALFQFQLMGLNGAFVTGDLFNLFVFFEVLLIASYVLMLHGQGRERYRVGLHYVVLNLAASALFLIGVALLYALTGTLNFADLALRVPLVSGPDAAVLQAAALLLLVVFGFKAALMPLAMWLPATYAAASAPVAALFAIMSKVGIYVILRLSLLVFGQGESAGLGLNVLLYGGIATIAFGTIGVLASQALGRLASYSVLVSSGTLLAVLGLSNGEVTAGALFYMVSSTLTIGAFFMLIELVERGQDAGASVLAVTMEAYGDADEEEQEVEIGVTMPGTIAVLGLSDLVVVRSGDAVLVAPRSAAQEIRRVVDALAAAGRSELL